jgi:hypothetical protein
MDGCGHLKGKRKVVAWSRVGPRHPCSFLPPESVCMISKLNLQKIFSLEKVQVHFSPHRSLKVKNAQNKRFMFWRVITKIKKIIEKSRKQYNTLI